MCADDISLKEQCFERNTNVVSLLQGFPGPQGLVGLPGEKVSEFHLQNSPFITNVLTDGLISVSQGPQGKKGMQGLPGNDGPPVRTYCMCFHISEDS